ncbi:MAG: HAMP domain-containing protein [Rhodospirillales bacterium]|nr:HAMP domain-containing protein [Rhodospirillales bacterium]
MKISIKLPVVIVVMSLVAAVVTGIIGFVQGKQALQEEAFNKLVSIQKSRTAELTRYLDSIHFDLALLAKNHMTIDALKAFDETFNGFGNNPVQAAHKLYISDNPHPTGEKHKLDAAADGSDYSKVHAGYHPYFREFLESRGYYDIFLVDNDANIVYSVFKELDYATNLKSGKWKDTDIGKIFRQVADNAKPDFFTITDFAPYAPSSDAPASFVATPVFGRDGGKQGVLIFQMPIGKINAIMQQSAGMGESGESYIVGVDKLQRSDSRFSKESTILKQKVDTQPVINALKGGEGVLIAADYRGIDVLSAYGLLDWMGVKWAILAEIDLEEVNIPSSSMRNFMLIAITLLIAVLAAIGVFFARSLTGPISSMTSSMGQLANGDLETEVPARGQKDEIGEMAEAVQVFKENAIKVKEMEAEQESAKHRTEEEKKAMMNDMADDFEASIGGVVQTVSSASTELQSSAETMSSTADQANSKASAVAAASDQASSNVQTVATAAEELSSSVSEISRQVSQSTQIAGTAVKEVDETNAKIQGLAEAAQKIGDVVELITDIAEQTNLLALNATIEAARAGDAGKGFAVVASEVKNLANQTAKATEEIGSQITGVQGATQEAVEAIGSIGRTINDMNEIASAIAAAVEEQGAATAEIARNVEQAASGTQEVSSNITGVSQAAGETGQAAGQILNAAQELSSQSEMLRGEVDKFMVQIRAA